MNDNVIEIEHLYKEYRLGLIGYGTLREDLQSWWARFQGKEDPNSMLFSGNESNDKNNLDHILALNDINLTVKRGERLGIVGKNGAGKTTLLKILARIASPTKGIARIQGRVASLIAVGTGFHGELTGRENVYLNGSILGLRKHVIDEKFDEIVDFSGVEKFIDTPIKRYSSGMSIRLGFAVAAHLDPDTLIIDEVLAVGDAEFREKALGKMREVSEEGERTILFVSHNMTSIKELCSRTILLDEGKIIMSGETHDIVNHYLATSNLDKQKKSHTVNLVNHKNSKGNAKGVLLWAQLLNSNKEPCRQFNIGDDIIVITCVDNKFTETNIGIEVKILSSNKLPVSIAKSVGVKKYKFRENQSHISISVKLKDLRLFTGEYLISLRARNPYGDQFEYIENCLSFEVISGGEVEKTGTSEKYGKGGFVHISSEWDEEDISSPFTS